MLPKNQSAHSTYLSAAFDSTLISHGLSNTGKYYAMLQHPKTETRTIFPYTLTDAVYGAHSQASAHQYTHTQAKHFYKKNVNRDDVNESQFARGARRARCRLAERSILLLYTYKYMNTNCVYGVYTRTAVVCCCYCRCTAQQLIVFAKVGMLGRRNSYTRCAVLYNILPKCERKPAEPPERSQSKAISEIPIHITILPFHFPNNIVLSRWAFGGTTAAPYRQYLSDCGRSTVVRLDFRSFRLLGHPAHAAGRCFSVRFPYTKQYNI